MFAPLVARPSATPAPPQRHESPRSPDPVMRPSRASWDIANVGVFAPVRRPIAVQPKLAIGRGDDPLEHEADLQAEHAMSATAGIGGMPLSRTISPGSAETQHVPAAVHEVLGSAGRALDPSTRAFMEPRFGYDFSRVRVHDDRRASESARSIDALAYTSGPHIAFSAGRYSPSTTEGRKLLAHELAHTVQQGTGAGPATIRRRRFPDAANLSSILPAGGTDLAAHEEGLVRLIHSAWRELSAADQMKVRTDAAVFGIAGPTEALLFDALAKGTRDQILKFAEAVRAAEPRVTMGDPALMQTFPRAGTSDAANIATLVTEADKVFDAVASGSRDSDLRDIFGPSNVAAAKAKFSSGKSAMHTLATANKVVTDRSGFSGETHVGGASTSAQILLRFTKIDNPTASDSIATMVHESMHAGNSSVDDLGYIGSSSFKEMTETDKLNNAADYEVVAFRILSAGSASAFPGEKFVPPGATIGGVTGHQPSQTESAVREASETYSRAWRGALNIHDLFLRELSHPAEWNTLNLAPEFGVPAGTHFSDALPFWSKVENMTIHKRPGIKAAAGKPESNPVTQIDIAQSESVIHKVADALIAAELKESEAQALEASATAPQKAEIAKGVPQEAKVLVSLIRSQKSGEMTGRVERDERAVDELAKAKQAPNFFKHVLTPRNPSAFVD